MQQTIQCVKKYGRFLKHLQEDGFPKKNLWALQFRKNLPICGHQTNNITEAAIRISKEPIFQRTKTFNIPQTLDFVLSRMDTYYKHRILSVSNNRGSDFHKSKYQSNCNKRTKDVDFGAISQMLDKTNVFQVKSATD